MLKVSSETTRRRRRYSVKEVSDMAKSTTTKGDVVRSQKEPIKTGKGGRSC